MELSDEFKAILEMLEHRIEVQSNLQEIASKLQYRAIRHDVSKYTFEEFGGFIDLKIIARKFPYGSTEYQASLKGSAVEAHWEVNTHHPEHYRDGIDDMSLLDIIEMVCDWRATNAVRSRKNLTDITWEESLEIAQRRFGLEEKHLYLIKLISEVL